VSELRAAVRISETGGAQGELQMIHARDDYDRIQDPANKIPDQEPVMLFRGQDVLAPVVLAFYADLLKQHHAQPEMIAAVLQQEREMRKWQRMNRCKLPDMPVENADV
jgi:hypothetical protein